MPNQCKDIPIDPILEWLRGQKGWSFIWTPGLNDAFPPNTPKKVKWAKMRQLIKKNLVDGCGCGQCRGDFEITAKGHSYLGGRKHA